MSGPFFSRVGTPSFGTGTSRAPSLPTQDTNGYGCLVAVVMSHNNATHNCATGGWVLKNQTNSGASFTASIWVAPQGSSAPTFTWTGSVNSYAIIGYVSGPDGPVDTSAISISAGNTGSGTTHTSTGFNTTQAKCLVMYVDAMANGNGLDTPTGWTEVNDNGASSSNAIMGYKQVETAGTSTGNISVTAQTSSVWVQWQFEIDVTDATDLRFPKVEVGSWNEPSGLSNSKVEVASWDEPLNGLAASKVEIGAWLETNDIRWSKVEIGAWLDPLPANTRRRMSLM